MTNLQSLRLIATEKTLRVTVVVSVGGGPYRSSTYTVPLENLVSADVVTLAKALDLEIMRRLRNDTLSQDNPLF